MKVAVCRKVVVFVAAVLVPGLIPAGLSGSGVVHAAGSQLIVNIDSPSFRKLATAIPVFATSPGASAEVTKMARDGSAELGRLLIFSGMFNVMGEAAFRGIPATRPGAQLKGGKDLDGIDVVQWKSIGVESLTIGELALEPDGVALSLRTVDINRNVLILGKRYRKVTRDQYVYVLRRYADQILKAYTGKPGIFSTKLTFVGRKSKGANKQIYISDFDGTNAVQITNRNVPHLSPNWSPDGRTVVFTSYEDGNPDLFAYDVKSGAKRKLSGKKGINSGGNFSPKGNLVAFTGSQNQDTDIFLVPNQGGERRPFLTGQGLDVDPAFSPDGKWIAFVSGRFGNPHIFRGAVQWDGDGKPRVTDDKRLTYAGWWNATPAWAPESDKIAFAGYDKDIDRFDLFMMNPDGTVLERLTIRTGDNERPGWAPNGQLIVFQSNRIPGQNSRGVAQLWIMNRDGGSQRMLNTGIYEATQPAWGPAVE